MSSNKKVKVLLVDDSAFMRKILTDIVNSTDTIEVIGVAKNGEEAINLVRSLTPDVVTMDIEMPILNGIEALKRIMKDYPVPVIMLSSLTPDGADTTLTCLDIGAVDFIQKPSSVFRINIDELKEDLVSKITTAARIDVKFKNKSIQKKESKTVYAPSNSVSAMDRNNHNLIVIGTSTGGPRALQSVIPLLPKDLPASILIVQHMPPGFTKSLADRLNTMSNITVKEAEDGEKILSGYAYIAPGSFHLKIKEKQSHDILLQLTKDDPVSGHRPSVDVLFESVSKHIHKNIIAVVMTGMGSDGSIGVKRLKEHTECYVIAQDESSSIVYGMPRSAVNAGAVDDIVPLNEIANYILRKLGV